MSGTNIYTLEECRLTVDGSEYDVSTISFEAVLNGIPSCTVGIAPDDKRVVSESDEDSDVNMFNLKRLATFYARLQDKAKEFSELSLSVRLARSGGGTSPIDPSFSLSNWLLIGVGLTRVTAVRGFSILCTLAHPAYKLMLRNGFFHIGKGVVRLEDTSNSVTTPLDAAYKCIDAAIEANSNGAVNVPFSPGGTNSSVDMKNQNEVAQDIKDAIKETRSALDCLRWDRQTYAGASDDIPYSSAMSGISGGENAMKYVMTRLWAESLTQTAWQALVGSVCPNLGLEVVPEYDKEKLVVGPCMPWTGNSVTIDSSVIDSVLMPGRDPDPVYGYLLYEGEALPAASCATTKEGSQENAYVGLTNACFVPKSSRVSNGSLRMCGAPSWLWMAVQKASSLGDRPSVTTGPDDCDDDHSRTPEIPVGDNMDLAAWNNVVFSSMNDLFMTEYRKGVVAELSCAFVPKYGGTTIYPGMRMSVRTGGVTLFSGRITSIRHTVDCTTSVATTNISMAYCVNGNKDDTLGRSPKSPVYGSTGKLQG